SSTGRLLSWGEGGTLQAAWFVTSGPRVGPSRSLADAGAYQHVVEVPAAAAGIDARRVDVVAEAHAHLCVFVGADVVGLGRPRRVLDGRRGPALPHELPGGAVEDLDAVVHV